ncbi:DUF4199 domain-containing protein [Flavobacterium luteum]|uniref:DUF4199 domain-containing protein n=1 Tax=Flavobacterium luteum TaxID=2026654 RepID=A0A7J5AKM7_9FLAO|nr:DUF4199 domain-containing protein [Flavobacterium luteum]KAB1158162.1 DUF4199 domain-containing protein [Flavobacterium luteum]
MKKIGIEIKWGLLFSIATLVWMIVENAVGLHDKYISKQVIYTNVFAVIAIAVYFLALKEKKQSIFNGNMTWRQGFLSGTILSIVISILSPMVQYITFTLISPQFFTNIIQYAVENKVQTQEQAEAYFSLKNYILQGVFGGLSMGVFTSAIVAFFLKTKNNKT